MQLSAGIDEDVGYHTVDRTSTGDNRLPESKHFHAHEMAESYIGKKVRSHAY
jgi:hypothetical protein